jgi:hypothetical protein
MNPDPGRGEEAGGSRHPADAEVQLANNVMLAEYATLRAEVDRRTNVQWNVVALQITSAGVIASLAISRVSDIALLGFALLWVLGALASYFLHRSFDRSSGS